MRWLSFCFLFSLHEIFVVGSIEKPADVKELKKLLRTKNNVLIAFVPQENNQQWKKWSSVLTRVSAEIYGQGTIALVNCGTDEGRKTCKKQKVNPKELELKHYSNGEYHKDYDRQQTVESVKRFMLDPTGDSPWEEEPTASDVHHLSDPQSMRKLLKGENLPVLIMFYAPWCGHCKRLKPEYARAASEIKGTAVLGAMDVDRPENNPVRDAFNITGYPTLLYFERGNLRFPYGGELNKDGLLKWLGDPQAPKEPEPEKEWADEPSEVAHLLDDTFSAYIATNPYVLVMFYAPWCGHCKAMKPDYTDAAKELADGGVAGKLAAVDATKARGLAETYGIKGFPSLKYFKDGEYAWDLNERTKSGIVEFMKDPKEPPPPPEPEKPWSEMESAVVHLTTETFATEMKKKKHALVMFYAPWCGHCKRAKPEYTKAAERYQDDVKVMFAAMDCTAADNQEVCTEQEVTGYPTIKYFSYLKITAPFTSMPTDTDLTKFMSEKIDPSPPATPTVKTPAPEEEWDPAILHLDHENFESVEQAPAAFVMYFAPWCGHCKRAKPEFSGAAKLLSPPEDTGILFAAVDCTKYQDLCKDVSGYPTFKLYKDGAFAKEYNGARAKLDFVRAVKEVKAQKTEL